MLHRQLHPWHPWTRAYSVSASPTCTPSHQTLASALARQALRRAWASTAIRFKGSPAENKTITGPPFTSTPHQSHLPPPCPTQRTFHTSSKPLLPQSADPASHLPADSAENSVEKADKGETSPQLSIRRQMLNSTPHSKAPRRKKAHKSNRSASTGSAQSVDLQARNRTLIRTFYSSPSTATGQNDTAASTRRVLNRTPVKPLSTAYDRYSGSGAEVETRHVGVERTTADTGQGEQGESGGEGINARLKPEISENGKGTGSEDAASKITVHFSRSEPKQPLPLQSRERARISKTLFKTLDLNEQNHQETLQTSYTGLDASHQSGPVEMIESEKLSGNARRAQKQQSVGDQTSARRNHLRKPRLRKVPNLIIRKTRLRAAEPGPHERSLKLRKQNHPSGIVIIPPGFDEAPANLLNELHPIEPSWYHGQVSQNVLLLFTPVLASRLQKDGNVYSSLITSVIQKLFSSDLYHDANQILQVTVAVVDRLPASRSLSYIDGHRADADTQGATTLTDDMAGEGMAYALVDDISFSKAVDTTEEGATRHLTLNIEEHEQLLHSPRPVTMKSKIQIPLANTVFQTGREDFVMSFTYKNKRKTGSEDTTYGLELMDFNVETLSFTATIKFRGPTGILATQIFTPLRPLTEPRRVVASMGNIIRQLGRDEDVFPASAELEKVINEMVATESLPASPVTVWALVTTNDIDTSLRNQQLLPQNLVPLNNRSLQRNPEQVLDQNQSDNSSSERDSTSAYPDLTQILRAGGRLHRVMSGGGGWGKKAGLLSISPAVGFDQTTSSSEFALSMPWANQSDELAAAIGSPVVSGDNIQFFLAVPLAEGPHSQQAGESLESALVPQLHSLDFGTTPSSIDQMPDMKAPPGENGPIVKSTFLPNQFGALSEKGVSISYEIRAAYPLPATQTRTMIDVPFSRIHIRQTGTVADEQILAPSAAVEIKPRGVLSMPTQGHTFSSTDEVAKENKSKANQQRVLGQHQLKPADKRLLEGILARPSIAIGELDDGEGNLDKANIRKVTVGETAGCKERSAEGALRFTHPAPSRDDSVESAAGQVPELSLIRTIGTNRNPTPTIRYHIRNYETKMSALRYERAVARHKRKKLLEQQRLMEMDRQNASREAAEDAEILKKVLLIAQEKGEGDKTSREDEKSAHPLSEVKQKYTETLAPLNDEELQLEKENLNGALKQAKLARKAASAAVDRMKMPKWASDEPQVDPHRVDGDGKALRNINIRRVQKLRGMTFEYLSEHFLKLKTGQSSPKDDTAREKYWTSHGFSMHLVDLLEEYHRLKPELPNTALASLSSSYEDLVALPFDELRDAAKKLPDQERQQFWKKWKLLRRMTMTVRSEAKAEFWDLLQKRARLEAATTADIERATPPEAVSNIDKDFKLTLFRLVGRTVRIPFHRKHQFWFTNGLTLETRAQLWTSPSTGNLVQALMAWVTRRVHIPGDAVGALILESIAWNSTFRKSGRFQRLMTTAPELCIKFDEGDVDLRDEEEGEISLVKRPIVQHGDKLLSEEDFRSLSEKAPWEYLYRMLDFSTSGKIPDKIEEKRTAKNRWRIKLAFVPLRDKLAPIFQKIDDAVNAHRASGRNGLIEVDIGKEIREQFSALLRTEDALRADLGITGPKITKVPASPLAQERHMNQLYAKQITPNVRRIPTGRLTFVRLPKPDLHRSVKLSKRTPTSDFRTEWTVNPNKFAFEIMEKRMRRKIEERLKERTALKRKQAHVASVGTGLDMARSEEEDEDEGVDYDLIERAIERKLDRRGIRQPTVRRLKLGQSEDGHRLQTDDFSFEDQAKPRQLVKRLDISRSTKKGREQESEDVVNTSSDTTSNSLSPLASWWDPANTDDMHLVSKNRRKSAAPALSLTSRERRRQRARDKKEAMELGATTAGHDSYTRRIRSERKKAKDVDDELWLQKEALRSKILEILGKL